MPSSLTAAWRALLKRLASDWLILIAALVTIALATILLASGPVYADAVTLSALQRSIADAPVRDANVEVSQRLNPDWLDIADAVVVEVTEDAFAATGVQTRRMVETESFGFPDQNDPDEVDLIAFQFFEDLTEHASLVSGSWPSQTSSLVESAIPQATAELLGLDVTDRITATRRRDASFSAEIVISGIYEIDDPKDPFWFDDPLAIHGVEKVSVFRSLGPFVVSAESIATDLAPGQLTVNWRLFPSHQNLAVSEVPTLRRRINTLEQDVNLAFNQTIGGGPSPTSEIAVDTGLNGLLLSTERSLIVTRTSVVALLIQLAILAGYALVLTAGLLVGARRGETHLLRSRGASPNQIGLIAVLEGLVLTIPVALVAPWLAARAIELLDRFGPLASIGLSIQPVPTTESYVLSGIAALGAVIALSWPAYRAAKRFPDATYEPRQLATTGTQRAGVDIALLSLAVVVFWQLQSLGPEISATVKGRFGVDPLLLIAPALGLLAGAILALRMIPLLGSIAERISASGRQIIAALSAWQVSRRPLRYARSALLLIMAVAIGFFAAAFSITWLDSQSDQAEFQVGADMRVQPNRRTNDSIPDLNLSSGHQSVEGVTTSMAVLRKTAQLARSGSLGELIFIDAAHSGDVVHIRDDLAPDFEALMDQLAQERPTLAGVELPNDTAKIGLAISAVEEWAFETVFIGPNFDPRFDLRVSAVVQDGSGLIHRVPLGSIPINIGNVRLQADLTFEMADGTKARPLPPLSLVDIEILSPIPARSHEVVVDLLRIYTTADGNDWQVVDTPLDQTNWSLDRSDISAAIRPTIDYTPTVADSFQDDSETGPESGGLSLTIETGAAFSRVSPPQYFSIRPRGTSLPDVFPVITSEGFLDANAVGIGDTIRLSSLRISKDQVRIAGSVGRFPTVEDPSAETVLIDLPTFQMMSYEPGVRLESASEYWLETHGGDSEEIETLLRSPQFESVKVHGLESRTDMLTSDPVALGTIGALSLGFVAAAVFATVGFAVSATVSARERVKEFGLLRALGLSSRQLAGWLSLEQGVLVVISLGLGTLVGALLTALVLPLVFLNQLGDQVVPEVLVVFPWRTVLLLELAVLAILGVTVLVLTVLIRRLGLASLLRLGDN